MSPQPPPRAGRARPLGRAATRWLVLLIGGLALLGFVAARPGSADGASPSGISWSDQLADLPGAAALAGGGHGVTVAVLDTWVDAGHPDFGGRVQQGASCIDGNCQQDGTMPDPCPAHGTHVAGLVGSRSYGVAPQVTLLPVRVLAGRTGGCTAKAHDVAMGIRWAVDHGAKIINISLGSTFAPQGGDSSLPQAVSDARHRGVLVVAAAGNGQAAGSSLYGPDALIVAALAPNGQLASYSQRGPGVGIAAPGGEVGGAACTPQNCVVSTWEGDSYASDAGTSMAAPFVSGTAALLLSENGSRNPDELTRLMRSTAHPLADAGAGRLDVLAAVKAGLPPPGGSRIGSDSTGNQGAGSAAPHSLLPADGGAGSTDSAGPSPAPAARPAAQQTGLHPIAIVGIILVGGVGSAALAAAINERRARR